MKSSGKKRRPPRTGNMRTSQVILHVVTVLTVLAELTDGVWYAGGTFMFPLF